MTKQTSDALVVGHIGAVYGVKGWLKIQSFTENPEDIFDYTPWTLQGNAARQTVEEVVNVVQWRRQQRAHCSVRRHQ